MRLLLCFLVSLCSLAFAASAKKSIELDLSGNGKVDFVQLFENGRLVRESEDRDGDGRFELVREFFAFVDEATPVEKITEESREGKGSRVSEVYELKTRGLRVTRVTGAETSYVSVAPLTEQRDCLSAASWPPATVNEFLDNFQALNIGVKDGYLLARPAHQVHRSCLEKWGHPQFINQLERSLSEGMACLAKLATRPPAKANGATFNGAKLAQLFKQRPVTVACQQSDYEWNGVAAHASTRPGQLLESLGVTHPYMSLNPNDPKLRAAPDDRELAELRNTLFHEQLHNLGIRHREGVEFAYTCGDCCVGQVDAETLEAACKICAGDYAGASDKRYLRDFIAWGKASYNTQLPGRALQDFLKENPRDLWGHAALAANDSGVFNPLGSEYAKLLERRFPRLGAEEKQLLAEAKKYQDTAEVRWGQRFAQPLAEVQFALLHGPGREAALEVVTKNLRTLKELREQQGRVSGNTKFVADDLVDRLNNLLRDMWLQDYPKTSPASSRAYGLRQELSF